MTSEGESIEGLFGVAVWRKNNLRDVEEGQEGAHYEAPSVLESCVEQCRYWTAEWKASNQEMESKFENCKAKVGFF